MTNKQQSLLSIPIAAVKLMTVTIIFALISPYRDYVIFVLPATLYNYYGSLSHFIGSNNVQFRFEDYQTTKDGAQKKLLELYPVGSELSKFDNDMQSLGYRRTLGEKELSFQHTIPLSIATGYTWNVYVEYRGSKITKLLVSKTPDAI
jgi:hypothetical protein